MQFSVQVYPRQLAGLTFFVLVLSLFSATSAQESDALKQEINAKQQELKTIDVTRRILEGQTFGINAQRDSLSEDIQTIENFKRLPDSAIKTANTLIRKSEQLIARALSPVEKFKAFEVYEKSEKSPDDFRKLFKTFRGVEPDRTTVQQQGIFERILDLERRKLLIADVGGPLVLAGKAITEVGFFFAKSSALGDFAARSLRNKIIVVGTKTSLKLEGLGRTSLNLAEQAKQSADRVRRAKEVFGVESLEVQNMMKKVNALSPEEIQKRISETTKVLEDASDEELRLVMDLAEGNPRFEEGIRDLQNAERDFAALADKLSGKVRVGQVGFIENVGQSRLVKKATAPVLAAANQVLRDMGKLKARVERQANRILDKLKPVQDALEQNQAAISNLVAEANRIEEEIEALRNKQFLARINEQGIEEVKNPIITRLSVGTGPRSISSDRFGRLVGLTNKTELSVSIAVGSVERRQCRHSCTRDSNGRFSCQTAQRNVFVRRGNFDLDARGLSKFGLKIDPSGVLKAANENGLIVIRGRGAGEGDVTVSGQGVKQINRRDHPCGSEADVVRGPISQTTRKISVAKVDPERVQITGLTSEEGARRPRLDMFGVRPAGLTIRLIVQGANGQERVRPISGGLDLATGGESVVATIRDKRGFFEVVPSGDVGTMTVDVKSKLRIAGSPVELGRILITNTVFERQVELPEGPWVLDGDNLLPPGETGRVRAIMRGGADPSTISIDWQVSGTRKDQLEMRKSDSFGSGEASIALAFDPSRVFDPSDDFKGNFGQRDITIVGTISRNGQFIQTLEAANFRLGQPVLKKVQIGLRNQDGGFVPVKRRDFITPTVSGNSQLGRISLRGTFDGGVEKFLKLSSFETVISGGQGLVDQNGVISLEPLGSTNGEISAGSTVFTSVSFQASVGPASGRGFYVLDGDKDDQFAVSVNKLTLEKDDDPNSRIIRARVIGPGNFSGFNVFFQTGSEELSAPLIADGEDLVAEVEIPDFSLNRVEVRNGAGLAIARLIPDIHGQPLGSLKIALDHPPSAEAGQVVVVSAQILNIESKGIESNGIRCVWNTDNTVARFDEDVTPLEPMTVTTGFCVNILRVNSDLPGGRVVDLPVGLALERDSN